MGIASFNATKLCSGTVVIALLLLARAAHASVSSTCDPVTSGLIGWWPGDGNTNDVIGSNNGMLKNGATFAAGKIGQAFSTDGVNDYVETASPLPITGNAARTACAWIKPAQSYPTACCPTPFSWGAPTGSMGFGNFIGSAIWHFWGYWNDIYTGVAVTTDWAFHCISYDSTKVVYYLDGKVIASQNKSLNTASSPLVIGDGFDHRLGGGTPTPFNGLVDEVLIYDRALTAAEVLILCNSCGGKCGLDHYMFYKIKTTKGTAKFAKFGPVNLAGEINTRDYNVIKPQALGLPANKNGEGVRDDVTHLKEYVIKPVKGSPKFAGMSEIVIQNQCNNILIELVKPVSILVPTNKSLQAPVQAPNPAAHDVDHFLCYKAKAQKKLADGTKLPKFPKGIQVDVTDQFQTRRYDLKKITKFCEPADKSGNPVFLSGPQKGAPKQITPASIKNPATSIVCYKAKPAKKNVPQDGCGCNTVVDAHCKGTKIQPKQPKHSKVSRVYTNNQFGAEEIDTKREVEFCIPSIADY